MRDRDAPDKESKIRMHGLQKKDVKSPFAIFASVAKGDCTE